MSDYLLDLGQNPFAKKLVKSLNLPIPLPEALRRASGAWTAEPFSGLRFAIGGFGADTPVALALRALAERGGATVVDLAAASEERADGLAFDATGITSADELASLFEFFNPRLQRLAPSSRILLVGLDPSVARDATAAAAQAALVGFVKSLAKEVGRKGSTAQLITLDAALGADKGKGADERRARALAGPLAFLLSARSAFISGQVLPLSSEVSAPGRDLFPETQPLAGKRAVVTGAAQGIGLAIAERLAQEGAEVLGVDHPSQAKALEEAMGKLAVKGHALAVDLSRVDAAREVAARVESEWSGVDVLVNNAGVTRDKTLARMSRAHWDLPLDVNLRATLAITEALVGGDGALIHLLQPEGRIVCLASISGLAGNGGQTNYAAAKAGVVGYVRHLAPRLAPRGITVNALAPGFIETRMTRAMPVPLREVARRFNALNQGGLPEDVAEACVFLASPGAFAVTGTTLRVCGLNHLGA